MAISYRGLHLPQIPVSNGPSPKCARKAAREALICVIGSDSIPLSSSHPPESSSPTASSSIVIPKKLCPVSNDYVHARDAIMIMLICQKFVFTGAIYHYGEILRQLFAQCQR
jgi:hypothetical protein